MNDLEMIELLNTTMQELAPGITTTFDETDSGEFFSSVAIGNPIRVHRTEINRNMYNKYGELDVGGHTHRITALVKCRLQDAYRGIIDFAQERLDELKERK